MILYYLSFSPTSDETITRCFDTEEERNKCARNLDSYYIPYQTWENHYKEEQK